MSTTPQITTEEIARYKKELKERLAQRPKLSEDFKIAYELGDARENYPQKEAGKALQMNENRIQELDYMIRHAEIVNPSGEKVEIGSKFKLKNIETEDVIAFRLVDHNGIEINRDLNEITSNSPIGKAVRNKKVGNEVEIKTPNGTKRFKIVEIR